MIRSQSSRELDHIKKDLLSLKSDVKSLAGALGKDNKNNLSHLRSRVSELGSHVPDSLGDTYRYALEQGEQAVDSTRKQVEKYPLTTLFGALFLGAALAAVFLFPRR